MTQQWTKTPPTEPGWYWFSHNISSRFEIVEVQLINDYDPERCVTIFWLTRIDDYGYTDNFRDAYWLGPLPVPEKPEEE